jgi:hypothetical protein
MKLRDLKKLTAARRAYSVVVALYPSPRNMETQWVVLVNGNALRTTATKRLRYFRDLNAVERLMTEVQVRQYLVRRSLADVDDEVTEEPRQVRKS